MSATVQGWASLTANLSDAQAFDFAVRSIMAEAWTITLVTVLSCTSTDTTAPIGTVDVQPCVHQVDGNGASAQPHGRVSALPFFRYAMGQNAIIMDPKAGDLGIALFASRDITNVKAQAGPAPPGSFRRFSPSDGIYIGAVPLQVTPTQYIRFAADGIHIHSTATVFIEALTAEFTGSVKIDGNLSITGTTTGTGDGTFSTVDVAKHLHSNAGGSGNSGSPVPGT